MYPSILKLHRTQIKRLQVLPRFNLLPHLSPYLHAAAFRPCYIRAYTDAKDIMPDTGAVLEGTKGATADDFLSWGEFRYMYGVVRSTNVVCVQYCIPR